MVTVGASITNVGPPDTVATGDNNVLLNGKPVARLDDMTAHGGTIVDGSSNIFINGVPAAYVTGMTVCPMVAPGPVPHIGGPIVTTGWQETN
ncbi:MAG: PAAR domain-containing protein [Candidatus Woesearchaeota archaeon]|nr:MAG: PAAR domain-containing protein [Candidatus Woesearchaeota archaeon]